MLRLRAAYLAAGLGVLGSITPVFGANFTVTGNDTVAKTLAPASGGTETGTVTNTGDLNLSGGTLPVAVNGGSGTRTAIISNSGKIRQTGTGRAIRANSNAVVLNVTNNSTGTISSVGDDTIQVSAAAAGSTFTLTNDGLVVSTSNRAVNLRDIGGSNTVTNNATGILRSLGNDAVRPGVNGLISNYGTIEAIPTVDTAVAGYPTVKAPTGSDGIQADNSGTAVVTGVQVFNYPSAIIRGRHGITGSATASAPFTITVTNSAGGTITGLDGSGINIDNTGSQLGNATVVNNGSILGQFDTTQFNTVDGDGVDVDGLVDLQNYGVIRGTGAGGNGSDGGGNNPEGVSIGGGSVVNYAGAEITGQDTSGFGTKGHGLLADNSSGGAAFGATSVTNTGLIRGFDSYAIRLIGNFADTITNNADGTIRGGGNAVEGAALQAGGGNDTLTNYGAIVGDNGLAIDLEGGDDTLHVLGGTASIAGDVSGGAGTNTMDVDPGTGFAFSYDGSLSGFAGVEIKSGSVTFSGASTYTGNTIVSGGALIVSNASGSATGSGTVSVLGGAVLRGTGTVTSVDVASGGTISPGTSPGTLHVGGDLALTAGAKFTFEVGAASDLLAVGGTVAFTGGGATIVDLVDTGVVPGQDYTLITFAGASGLSSDNFVLGSGLAGIGATLEVTGTALVLHTPDVSVDPSSVTFGSQVLGTTSDEQTVTVTNTGTANLVVGSPLLAGAHPAAFDLGANNCTTPVAPGDSCTIGIAFAPNATGERHARIEIPTNASVDPEIVTLTGTGVAALYRLEASEGSVDFGSVAVDHTSSPHGVTITNTGNSATTVSGFTAGGSHPTEFAVQDNCSGHLLAVGGTCSVAFTFTPAAPGTRSASELVSSSPAQTDGSIAIALAGIGTQPGAVLAPSSLAFGNQLVGTTSLSQPVTLSNNGNSTLTITSIAASGDFSQVNGCGAVLAAGAFCTIDVSFSPTVLGTRNGTLSVTSSAPDSPAGVALSGDGIGEKPGTLSFTLDKVTGYESKGSAVFRVTRKKGSEGPVSVHYATADGTAHAGEDYGATSGTLSWVAGDTSVRLITVPLIDDPVGEPQENFTVALSGPTGGATLARALTTGRIMSNDKPGSLVFDAARVTVPEDAGSVTLTVHRRDDATNAVSALYSLTPNSAKAGNDYVPVSGELTWSAGDTGDRTITIPIVWDGASEPNEYFTAVLAAGPSVGRERVTIRNVAH